MPWCCGVPANRNGALGRLPLALPAHTRGVRTSGKYYQCQLRWDKIPKVFSISSEKAGCHGKDCFITAGPQPPDILWNVNTHKWLSMERNFLHGGSHLGTGSVPPAAHRRCCGVLLCARLVVCSHYWGTREVGELRSCLHECTHKYFIGSNKTHKWMAQMASKEQAILPQHW